MIAFFLFGWACFLSAGDRRRVGILRGCRLESGGVVKSSVSQCLSVTVRLIASFMLNITQTLSAAGRITTEGLAALRETPPTVSVFFNRVDSKFLVITTMSSAASRQP